MSASSSIHVLPEAQAAEIHRRVFVDSPDFISYCRMDGTYLDVNPAFERFVGLPREQIVGRTPLEIGLWPSPRHREAFVHELRAKGQLHGYHKRLSRASGEMRDIEGWGSIVEIGGEDVLVAMGRDITERKRDEHELRQYRDCLEQLVEQRTRDLSEANHALQQANEAKRTFMASMSHELRTPLNAILGYAQLLKLGSGLTERQLAGLNTIEQGGQHLLALITDILDLARVEAGKLLLSPKPLDLRGFLGVVADIIRVRAEEKMLVFRCELAPDLPGSVQADEQRLRQILLNLLGNAIKFTDAGEVALRVSARPRNGRTRLAFTITDTGIGIAPQDQARLFRPFEQVSDARRRVNGAGLGLSISQALTRLMGSEIVVQSTVGQGSTFGFELELPVLDAPVPPPAAARMPTGYLGPRRRVLVADDVPANRMMLSDMLQMLGFGVVEAENGEQALAQLAQAQPDLVLMDVVMPVMGGIEAMRRLRALPAFARLPVIAISASVTHEHGQACLAAGASAYLPKPVDALKLVEQIGTLLDLRWTR